MLVPTSLGSGAGVRSGASGVMEVRVTSVPSNMRRLAPLGMVICKLVTAALPATVSRVGSIVTSWEVSIGGRLNGLGMIVARPAITFEGWNNSGNEPFGENSH